jgi:hypothetical protein
LLLNSISPLFDDCKILFPDTPKNIIQGLNKNTMGGDGLQLQDMTNILNKQTANERSSTCGVSRSLKMNYCKKLAHYKTFHSTKALGTFYFQDLHVDGSTILKSSLKEQDVRVWTALMWLCARLL